MRQVSKPERADIAEAWIEDRMVTPAANEAEKRLVTHMKQSMAQYDAAAAGLMAELAEHGYALRSVADLERLDQPYRTAIPVLLRWLPRIEYRPSKESICDALAVRWAKREVLGPLLAECRAASDWQLRWTVGDALWKLADHTMYDNLVPLATDRSYGGARGMVVLALAKTRNPAAVDVLIGELEDESVDGLALQALGRLKALRARPHVEQFLKHPDSQMRAVARRALAAIDKAAARAAGKSAAGQSGAD